MVRLGQRTEDALENLVGCHLCSAGKPHQSVQRIPIGTLLTKTPRWGESRRRGREDWAPPRSWKVKVRMENGGWRMEGAVIGPGRSLRCLSPEFLGRLGPLSIGGGPCWTHQRRGLAQVGSSPTGPHCSPRPQVVASRPCVVACTTQSPGEDQSHAIFHLLLLPGANTRHTHYTHHSRSVLAPLSAPVSAPTYVFLPTAFPARSQHPHPHPSKPRDCDLTHRRPSPAGNPRCRCVEGPPHILEY